MAFVTDSDLSATGAGQGANMVGFIQGDTGAVSRNTMEKVRETISVRDFGATGDGTTDDTAAIQNAIDYVRTLRDGELYFPPNQPGGAYRIEAPLTVDGSITIRGAGVNAVTIMAFGLSVGDSVLDFDCTPGAEQADLSGFTLRSNDRAPHALRLHNVAYVRVRNIRYQYVTHGCVIEGTRTFSHSFEDVDANDIGGNTVRFEAGFSGGGHFVFSGCTFTGGTGLVITQTAATDGLVFTGCNFEGCASNSVYVAGTCRGLTFIGCRTEGCGGDDFQFNPTSGNVVEGLVVSGCSFTTGNGGARAIILGGAGGMVRGFSITGNQVSHAGIDTAFVLLNGEGESGLVAGNYFAQSNTTPTSGRRAGVVVFSNENSSGKCEEYWGTALWGVAEGAFIPVDASGAGLTLTASGRFTRIGRMMQWQAFVQYPTTASSANCAIGGLPLDVSSGSLDLGRAGARVDGTDSGLSIGVLQGVPGSTQMALINSLTAAPISNTLVSGKYLYLSGSYMI